MTEPEPLQQIPRTYVQYRGLKLSYFSGCDYFRLSTHARVSAALCQGLKNFGLNVAASRLTSGNHQVYLELEESLASFFGAADALLVPSGYMTNLVVAQGLSGNFSHAIIDEKAHPSLADAAAFLDCPVVRFGHRSPQRLKDAMERCGPGAKVLLLTDGLFSHDGGVAPLREYLTVLGRDSVLLVDDAHAGGVLGKTGKGTLEYWGLNRSGIVQTVTLSKAFGVFGGAVLATPSLRRRIVQRSRAFVGGTPIPPPLANAALASISVLRQDVSLRERLIKNADYLKTTLRTAGFLTESTPGPIVSFSPKGRAAELALKKALLEAGIYPPFIRYPGGAPGGYFRFAVSSEHTPQQLDSLLSVLLRFQPRIGSNASPFKAKDAS